MYATKRRGSRRNHASRDRLVTLCGIALSASDRYNLYASDCADIDCQRCRRSLAE